MIMTGTTINIDNLRSIVHFVETYKYLTCSQSELIAIYVTMTFIAFVLLEIIQEHSQDDLTRKIC